MKILQTETQGCIIALYIVTRLATKVWRLYLEQTTSSTHKAQATLKLKLHLSTQNAGLHIHNTVQRQNNNTYLWWQYHIGTVIPETGDMNYYS